MQEVRKEDLEQIIKDAKKAGKDTAKLEEELKVIEKQMVAPMGKMREKKIEKGARVIESTGPIKEEDFE